MIGKICRAVPGGSARGGIRYILGYALGSKEDAAQARADFHATMSEASLRPDGGVGVVWSPSSGNGKRPSAIYAGGVTSLLTADLEMSATASANPRAREQIIHLVFSLQADVERSDAEMIAGVRDTLDRLGVGHHQYVISLHRDTADLHAHVALGAVDPITYRAMDRYRIHERMHRAMRETEVARGWEHDRGLYVVRDAGLSTQRIEASTKAERRMWADERRAERLDRVTIRKAYLNESFERKADATIAPRLQASLDAMRERDERPDWSDVHLVAAKYGARLEFDGAEGDDANRYHPYIVLREVLRDDAGNGIDGGDCVRLDTVLDDRLADLGAYRDLREAEADLVVRVQADPDYVARRIGIERSTFDRNDLVRFLDERLSDVGQVEALADLAERKADLRIVSVDTHTPLYSYEPQAQMEDRLAEHARTLVNSPDERFQRAALMRAVGKVERDIGSPLSEEQRAIVEHLDRRLVVAEGDPGTGKTVAMRVVKEYADLTGREIVGLTISQAAARRLEDESGIRSYNTAKGTILEELGERVIPQNGILVLDEAGMDDARTTEHLLRIVRERNATVVVIGDTKQLQPILACQSLRILREEAHRAGAYETLIGIQRQRNQWHRDAVKDLADGLRAIEATGAVDEAKIRSAVDTLDRHGVFSASESFEALIDDAAASYCADRALGLEAVYMAASKETQRYANEAVRGRLGLVGAGVEHRTRYGTKEFAVGDTVVLRENHTFRESYLDASGRRKCRKSLQIVNGDKAKVISVDGRRLHLRLEDGRSLKIDTLKYDAIDHGYVQTYHTAQGSSLARAVMILDRAASAELFFVGASRSKESIRILYSRDSFEDVDDIAQLVADRSTLKTTSRNFEELLARSVGNDPLRKKIVEEAMASESHPLRRQYDLVEAEKRERRDQALRSLRVRFTERRKSVESNGALTLTARLEADRGIERDHRQAARKVVDAYRPTQFGRFVHDETVRAENEHGRQTAREQQRRDIRQPSGRDGRAQRFDQGWQSDDEERLHGYEHHL